jgi:hypothetical protein
MRQSERADAVQNKTCTARTRKEARDHARRDVTAGSDGAAALPEANEAHRPEGSAKLHGIPRPTCLPRAMKGRMCTAGGALRTERR